MYLISAEQYKSTGVHFLRVRKIGEIWVSMKNVYKGLGVKNMSDLILREIYGIYKTKSYTKEQIKRSKMTERVIFEKHANLSEDEINTKTNKNVYVKSDVMSTVIKCCRREKKVAKEK